MNDAIGNIEKRSKGRPRTDATPVMVRLAPNLLDQIDRWRDKALGHPNRPEAIRRLIEKALSDD